MTDVSGTRGPWAVLAGGAAVLLAATLSLLVPATDPASADTVLRDPRSVVLVAADGTTRQAADGAQVPPGTVVRTGEGGSAELATGGRQVLLGALTSVAVLDGVRQRLERGLLLADVRRGPRLGLDSQAGTTRISSGAVVRVERGPLLRVGVFGGRVSLRSAGRALVTAVPELHQVQATYAGLPGRATALALADDAWEQRVALPLVTADLELRALAGGLDGPSGRTVLTAAPAELRTGSPVTGTASLGEQALRVALAQVAHQPGSVAQHLQAVTRDRNDGGSWGVVAALAAARVGDVSALLDRALPQAAPLVVALGPAVDPLSLLGAGASGVAAGPAAGALGSVGPGPSPGAPAPAPAPRPSTGPVPVPVPVPVPSLPPAPVPVPPLPVPVPTLPSPLVQSVVDEVLSLLPAPVPVPQAASTPVAVLPAPLPSLLSGVGVRLR